MVEKKETGERKREVERCLSIINRRARNGRRSRDAYKRRVNKSVNINSRLIDSISGDFLTKAARDL